MKLLRIGTRGSRLALAQARLVQGALEQACPGIGTELVILRTKGDRILDRPFSQIGEKGLFVAEFEQALSAGRIDLAVHSAKDLPVRLAEGLCIAGVLKRGDVRDVLVLKAEGPPPERLAGTGAFVLGTASQRRSFQAERLWPAVSCRAVRGNVETRLRKLEEGQYDGLLLAKAGLDRLGIGEEAFPRFRFFPQEADRFLPAACQGVIAVEARNGSPAAELAGRVSHPETMQAYETERQVLKLLQADCSQPVGAWCRRGPDGFWRLDVMYGSRRACCRAEEGETGLARMAVESLR